MQTQVNLIRNTLQFEQLWFFNYYFKKQGTKSPEKHTYILKAGKSRDKSEADLLLKMRFLLTIHIPPRILSLWQWCWGLTGNNIIQRNCTIIFKGHLFTLSFKKRFSIRSLYFFCKIYERTDTKGIIWIHTTPSLIIPVDKAKWTHTALFTYIDFPHVWSGWQIMAFVRALH